MKILREESKICINGKDYYPPIDPNILELPEAEQKLACSPTRSPVKKSKDLDRSGLKNKIN